MDIEKSIQLNILETLNLTNATQEAQQQTINEATDIILNSVITRIKNDLSDEASDRFDHVFRENSTEEERSTFLEKNVPNLTEIITQESLRYKYLIGVMVSP